MSAPPDRPQAVRLLLSGRVQGVGFRFFVRRLGEELGLAGRVRNLPDGRVEIVAAGDGETLARFKEEVRVGPPGARVSRVEESDEHELTRVPGDGFEIEH
jgi:acylphosphatase